MLCVLRQRYVLDEVIAWCAGEGSLRVELLDCEFEVEKEGGSGQIRTSFFLESDSQGDR
jgi:hypothetical protein